jgi:G:T-mismatch repair DNA endonuclease (very short patch repair protein)
VQPPASTAPFSPEPALADEQYNNILNIMDSMVHVMEYSPSAFADSDEETIRSHFLVQLNGQYQGQATGETFNYEGKTDILIKDQGRNIFIAECKFWHGEKAYVSEPSTSCWVM